MPTRPVLITNPRDDQSFAAAANRLLEQGVDDPRDLEETLRSAYPAATVRPRELSSEPVAVWYVYREGRWVPPAPAREE